MNDITSLGKPDDSLPSDDRQMELVRLMEQNDEIRRSPCSDIPIRTRGELLWIMEHKHWSGMLDPALEISRPNFSHAKLTGVVLGDIELNGVDFSHANLSGVNLEGASLFLANLSHTDLRHANLHNAYLPCADMHHADLESAKMNNAHLIEVNLGGAYLDRTDLSAADLWSAHCDVDTMFRSTILSMETCLGDVIWNGTSLTQIDWLQLPKLGDEILIKEAESRFRNKRSKEARLEIAKVCRKVERTYRALSIALRQQGMADAAKQYRLCELQIERKALKLEGKRGQLFFSQLLNVVARYGEQPINTLFAYIFVILSFTGIYWVVTNYFNSKLSKLSIDECLVLSITSFHGRGFFPGTLPLGDTVARFGAVEAIIGLFIELVFIATFSRRFLGN